MSEADDHPGTHWQRVMSGRDRSTPARLLRGIGRCIAPAYASAIRLRNLAYARGWRHATRLPRPVISVGNITTGGTGKTPMVAHLLTRLQQLGRNPAILLRGYRATRTGGESDEATLLRRTLGDAVAIGVGPDRVATARRLLRERPEIDLFILDDGFQHRRVQRDLDIVLIDATNPFGYGHLLPRGLLREPLPGLRRADAVFVTRAETLSGIHAADELEQQIARHHGRAPLAWFAHRWARVVDAAGDTVAEPPGFAETPAARRRVLAFCGIGSPGPFLTEAMRWFDVLGARTFADHHAYTAAEVRSLTQAARDAGADALLTTEKDWVKLARLASAEAVAVWRPELRLECMRGEDAVEQLLAALP